MSIIELLERGKQQRKRVERKKAMQKAALGAAVGVLVGATAGVLLAPKSGKETRTDISNAAKEVIEKLKEAVEKDQNQEVIGEIAENADYTVEDKAQQ